MHARKEREFGSLYNSFHESGPAWPLLLKQLANQTTQNESPDFGSKQKSAKQNALARSTCEPPGGRIRPSEAGTRSFSRSSFALLGVTDSTNRPECFRLIMACTDAGGPSIYVAMGDYADVHDWMEERCLSKPAGH
jgi:hypothetical protein